MASVTPEPVCGARVNGPVAHQAPGRTASDLSGVGRRIQAPCRQGRRPHREGRCQRAWSTVCGSRTRWQEQARHSCSFMAGSMTAGPGVSSSTDSPTSSRCSPLGGQCRHRASRRISGDGPFDGRGRPARCPAPHRGPTLLLCEELDQRSPLQVAAELAARIPAAELVVIPGVGHISNAEAPETFNACVREFLWSWTVSADPNRPADRSNATGVQGRESLRQLTSGCPRPTRTPK